MKKITMIILYKLVEKAYKLTCFLNRKQIRYQNLKKKLIFNIACDHYSEEAKTNYYLGIIDLFPLNKAVNYMMFCLDKNLVDAKYELITNLK